MIDQNTIAAVIEGNLQVVKGLAASGEDFIAEGGLLLRLSAGKNHVDLMDVMRAAGVDLETPLELGNPFNGMKLGVMALIDAAQADNVEAAAWLLEQGVPALEALRADSFGLMASDSPDCVRLLVEEAHKAGHDIGSNDEFIERLERGTDFDRIEWLIEKGVIDENDPGIQVAIAYVAARTQPCGYASDLVRRLPELRNNDKALTASLHVLSHSSKTSDFEYFHNLAVKERAFSIDTKSVCLTNSLLRGNAGIARYILGNGTDGADDWAPSFGLLRSMIRTPGTEEALGFIVSRGLPVDETTLAAEVAINQGSSPHLDAILENTAVAPDQSRLMDCALAGKHGCVLARIIRGGASLPRDIDGRDLSADVRRVIVAHRLRSKVGDFTPLQDNRDLGL